MYGTRDATQIWAETVKEKMVGLGWRASGRHPLRAGILSVTARLVFMLSSSCASANLVNCDGCSERCRRSMT